MGKKASSMRLNRSTPPSEESLPSSACTYSSVLETSLEGATYITFPKLHMSFAFAGFSLHAWMSEFPGPNFPVCTTLAMTTLVTERRRWWFEHLIDGQPFQSIISSSSQCSSLVSTSSSFLQMNRRCLCDVIFCCLLRNMCICGPIFVVTTNFARNLGRWIGSGIASSG